MVWTVKKPYYVWYFIILYFENFASRTAIEFPTTNFYLKSKTSNDWQFDINSVPYISRQTLPISLYYGTCMSNWQVTNHTNNLIWKMLGRSAYFHMNFWRTCFMVFSVDMGNFLNSRLKHFDLYIERWWLRYDSKCYWITLQKVLEVLLQSLSCLTPWVGFHKQESIHLLTRF